MLLLAASSEGASGLLDLLIWAIAAGVWLFANTAAKRRKKKAHLQREPHMVQAEPQVTAAPARPPRPPVANSNELSAIFERLGAQAPPPPAPSARNAYGRRAPSSFMARRDHTAFPSRPAAPARPKAVVLPIEAPSAESSEPAVQSQLNEQHLMDSATRHTGMILPQMYAMGMRLTPWPSLPMPGMDRTHHTGRPLGIRLHGHANLRDAVVAQTLLQPSKGFF
ncbi:MAG: hypothetical protein LBN38_08175 [Verrucomicrobiota bacterium]|jgi:hypothetical protein|nr:hypothetical protein [Verrucomicrobiota bacterium]